MYKKSIEDVIMELNSSLDGLTENDAIERLKTNGLNIIDTEKKTSKISLFLKQFEDAMIIMLLIVAIISFVYSYIMHESLTDGIIIIFIVFLNALMGYMQESKAEDVINSLSKINTCKVKVKRENTIYLIDSIKLVNGDIIILDAGDKIPADCRIIEATNALVDESILTGESECVSKVNVTVKKKVSLSERINMVYSGCNLVKGKITAVVCSTGLNTELGSIAQTLVKRKDVPTPLQMRITEISRKLSIIVIFIIGFVFIYNILFLKNTLLDIIMLCISLMVSAVPEGLPAVISISLSLGVKNLAKKNTLVRTLSSVETLGSVDVICTDKTGTITKNEMTVKSTYSNKKVGELSKLLEDTMVLCNDSEYDGNKFIGDPTEVCLMNYSKKSLDIMNRYKRIIEIPFDSERKMMSTVNFYDNNLRLFVKGSLDSIMDRIDNYIVDNEVIQINDEIKKEILEIEESFSKSAFRVLAFAYKDVLEDEINNKDIENNLTFIGMVGMIDPERDGVIDSIKLCKTAGITPIMITGDSLTTALAIAKNIGLCEDDSEGILGTKLNNYSDAEMINVVKKYKVYARVSPEDKVRIVTAWQKNNKVVAMTGDGVNDAPAIRLAHVGIGMGNTGTEVTKSVSDILLLDDCFNTIVGAIKEGRRIYNNIRSVILYSLSSNFAELFIVIIGMFLGVNILLPIQILFIDLFTDAILAICMAFEKESKNIMEEPPHSRKHFFTPFMTSFLITSAILECILIFIVYFIGSNSYDFEVAQSMAFLCLIVQEMVFAYNCRNLKQPIIKQGLFSNRVMNIGIILLAIVQLIVFLTPIKSMLHIVTLGFTEVLVIVIMNIIIFILMEFIKVILSNYFKD